MRSFSAEKMFLHLIRSFYNDKGMNEDGYIMACHLFAYFWGYDARNEFQNLVESGDGSFFFIDGTAEDILAQIIKVR